MPRNQEWTRWSCWMMSMILYLALPAELAPQPQQTTATMMLHDICIQNPYGTRRYFLDDGQNGTLIAKNLDYDRIVALSSPRAYYHYYNNNPFFAQQQQQSSSGRLPQRVCSIELTTCPTCSIQMQFKILNLPSCDDNTTQCSGCDHLAIKENYYASPWIICGTVNYDIKLRKQKSAEQHVYHSIGRSVTLSFVFSQSYDYAFLVEFASVANTRLITGRNGDEGVISSPHFPTVYPQDYSSEIKLRNVADPPNFFNSYIRLIFDDFALGSQSFIEVSDADGMKHYWLGSALFRPPVIMIRSKQITVRFVANGGRASGYRATYKFINGSSPEATDIPATDCGGVVDNYGGAITMSNMSAVHKETAQLYDCVWLIKPFQQEAAIHTSLALRIEEFSSLKRGTTLEVRQGLTSLSPLVDVLSSEIHLNNGPLMISSPSEYLVPADVGFYVRLRGRLDSNFKMAISYSAFSYTECYTAKEFVCLNHRCISANLRCDGFNHCGDNSDEQTACSNQITSPQDPSWWLTHSPNYYFPKMGQYGELGATSLVLFVATIGVIVFIVSILTLLYRMSSHSQLMNERQARLEFIRSQLVNGPQEEPEVENPPSYEAPPDYTEICKLAQMAKETNGNYDQLAGLRVLIPATPGTLTPNPTPIRRHRDLIRQARGSGLRATSENGSGMPSPSPSSRSTSTVARSRNATPQRRLRRTSAALTVPVHLDPVEASFIPNSPPPPYEVNPNSPFHISRQEDSFAATPLPEAPEDPKDEVIRREVDCDCPGACSCVYTPPLDLVTSSSGDHPEVPSTSSTPRPDSAACLLSDTPQTIVDKQAPLSDQRGAMAGLFKSVDHLTPALNMLKQFSWNKSF